MTTQQQQQQQLVCVGDCLGSADQFHAGEGTYQRAGLVYASIVGQQRVHNTADPGQPPRLTVTPVTPDQKAPVPCVGDLVYARVTKVESSRAVCRIVVVGRDALHAEFGAVIRQIDVRRTQVDQVVLSDCFRPGDLVRARVHGWGDARSYWLSTAEEALGVVAARGPTGVLMVPKGWELMECPDTGVQESRKVADFRV